MRVQNGLTYVQKQRDGDSGKEDLATFGVAGQRKRLPLLLPMLLALVSALWVSPCAAQDERRFERDVGFGSPEKTGSVAIGDLNSDGFLDIVQGNNGQSYIYFNDGKGHFDLTNRSSFGDDSNDPESVAVGDLNGDGFLDIVEGNIGQSYVYFNDGKGGFDNNRRIKLGDEQGTWAVAIGDLNGDGFLDIVQGNSGQSYIYLSDGRGNFSLIGKPFGSNQDTHSIALGDLDGDGDLDIVQGSTGLSYIYVNDGQGNFPPTDNSFGDNQDTHSIALGDLDGDGDLDIVQGNFGQSYLYHNDGQGTFSNGIPLGKPYNTSSIAVADLNGDGDLDIVQSNGFPEEQPNHPKSVQSFVYVNDEGFKSIPIAFGNNNIDPTVAIADLDNDSDLDIIQGNRGQQSNIYFNIQLGELVSGTSFDKSDSPQSITLGDIDDDGNLDIVGGNFGQSYVFWNDGNTQFRKTQRSNFGSIQNTRDVALGDLNNDGKLDIVQGNSRKVLKNGKFTDSKQESYVYLNSHEGLFARSIRFGDRYDTFSLALGDLDNDGDLDIVQGNIQAPSYVYLNSPNEEGRRFTDGIALGKRYYNPKSKVGDCLEGFFATVALGDLDGDGDLDIVQGNNGQSYVYLNDGKGAFTNPILFGSTFSTYSVALGDLDDDDDLDIVQGNFIGQSYIYLNNGQGTFGNPIPLGSANQLTWSVALGDLNGDGFLDIVQGNRNKFINCVDPGTGGRAIAGDDYQSYIYLNDGEGGFPLRGITFGKGDSTLSVALGDLNQDGLLDIVHGTDEQSIIYLNSLRQTAKLPNNGPRVTVSRPITTANADFYSSPAVQISHTIPITYILFDPEGDPVGHVAAFYSLNGGGHWQPAIATTETMTTHLTTSATGEVHDYIWDTFASGFFGRSDNVVMRIVAYSHPPTTTMPITGTYGYTNAVAGPYQHPYVSATTFPFRVRGTQVRVYAEAMTATNVVSNVLVYRLPVTQTSGALPIGGVDTPFRSDGQGYLQGRGRIAISDTLVALLPITSTDNYTLYYTNITPTLSGLTAFTVTVPGVQELVVSAAKPLLLLNLDIALEWDARKDKLFLEQLAFDLRRASALLFDWTNGQVALGRLTLHHNREDWQTADIQIYATNRLRPNATIGGIVDSPTSDIDVNSTEPITYTHGRVRIGSVWNRYGETNGNLGEDWPAALAHELGHYALYLNDHYLGLKHEMLTQIDSCGGSAMANPYRDDYSEFLMKLDDGCKNTLAAQTTGRADWETIAKFYPPLTYTVPLTGPHSLPLAVTQIVIAAQPYMPPTTLDSPMLFVTQNNQPVQLDRGARAFLFQAGADTDHDRLIDLGTPQFGQIQAYGARTGDRVCLYQLNVAPPRLGCKKVASGDMELKLTDQTNWQPEVTVSPVNSVTVDIIVTVPVAGLEGVDAMQARLYPLNVLTPSVVITMKNPVTSTQSYTYTGKITLTVGDTAGYVHIWVVDKSGKSVDPPREIVTDYALGGSPPFSCGGSGCAPGTSADGQVILYGRNLEFADGQFYTLQATTTMPNPPAWATVVGQAYRVAGSVDAPPLDNKDGVSETVSISFQYLGRDVPPGEEQWLKIYYRKDMATQWDILTTTVNITYNIATALTPGEGLYALMSSTEIPLTKGWNLIGYPIQESRPITEALASLNKDDYTIVCGYEAGNQNDSPDKALKIFEPDGGGKKDLMHLNFGQGYWIKTTKNTTLRLRASINPFVPPSVPLGIVAIPPTCKP